MCMCAPVSSASCSNVRVSCRMPALVAPGACNLTGRELKYLKQTQWPMGCCWYYTHARSQLLVDWLAYDRVSYIRWTGCDQVGSRASEL
eukprot:693875-Pelagomonas_calceolata.AAC.4